MLSGERLALQAMEKELVRLTKIAERDKHELDEWINVGTELIAIHEEFAAIVKSNDPVAVQLKKLDVLKQRQKRADKIMQKDFQKLSDKQFKSECDRGSLAQEIGRLKFRLALRHSC